MLPSDQRPKKSLPRLLWALFTLFVVYGTTIPFTFTIGNLSLGYMFHRVNWSHVGDHRGGMSLPDIVQNILLFIPFGFLGGGSAIPSVHNSKLLGRLTGVPYVPLTPYGAPLPLPVQLEVHYGAPMMFEGTGNEEDEFIQGYVDRVKDRIAHLIENGRAQRRAAS